MPLQRAEPFLFTHTKGHQFRKPLPKGAGFAPHFYQCRVKLLLLVPAAVTIPGATGGHSLKVGTILLQSYLCLSYFDSSEPDEASWIQGEIMFKPK